MSQPIEIAVFSGGRGSASILRALAKNPHVALTVLINAYDDGLSTGLLRHFIRGFLGPSDVRKCLVHLMPRHTEASTNLAELLEYRLPADLDQEGLVAQLEAMAAGRPCGVPGLQALWLELTLRTVEALRVRLAAFLARYRVNRSCGITLDLREASLGNLLLAGEYLIQDESFNAMIAGAAEIFRPQGRILNVTSGENLYLAGLKEDGDILASEAQVVGPQTRARLRDIFLLDRPLGEEEVQNLTGLTVEEKHARLARRDVPVRAGTECLEALERADVVLYAPGTQNSSLFPSYLSEGIGEAIAANRRARKIFVANIMEDHEIPAATVNSLIDGCVRFLNRRGRLDLTASDYITDVLAHRNLRAMGKDARYLFFRVQGPGFERIQVKESDWEQLHAPGRHRGERVATQVLDIIREDRKVPPYYYTVSIIVPALDEERTVGRVLEELRDVDLGELRLESEVVLVDGGSRDATVAAAGAVEGIRVHRLPAGRTGKGAALRHGLEVTVSDLVVFFPADGEYRADSVRRVLKPIVDGDCHAVLGARNLRPHSDRDSLATIYGSRRLLYMTSLLGGRLLGLTTFLLYSRFISDPLTSVRAFIGSVVRGASTTTRGFDYELEVLGDLLRRDATVFEVPVPFRPRTRAEGKKIRVADGLACLSALVRARFSRRRTVVLPPLEMSDDRLQGGFPQ